MARDVYIISDLHLGGAHPATDDPDDRGFRICTHGRELAEFVALLAARPAPMLVQRMCLRIGSHWVSESPDTWIVAPSSVL